MPILLHAPDPMLGVNGAVRDLARNKLAHLLDGIEGLRLDGWRS